jgi:dienelactone hydrolase
MKNLFAFFTLLTLTIANSQESYYDHVKLGKYHVAYTDTILYDASLEYKQFGYEGDAPLFVQIWHPTKNLDSNYLTYNDFREMDVPKDLKMVHTELNIKKDSAFVWYNIADDFVKYEPINYKKYTPYDVLKELKKTETRSISEKLNPRRRALPVIIYHHGSQGLSEENYLMAEYFASQGFIFITANFHLPYKTKTYGLSNSDGYKKAPVQKLISFATTISNTVDIFMIGHSWGAQTGFSFLRTQEDVKAFVSMETTLEDKDSLKIQELWPSLVDTIYANDTIINLPILMLANNGDDNQFDFTLFEKIKKSPMVHAISKKEFGHESYTSIYTMRYLYHDQFKQPDEKELSGQLDLYVKHLKLIEAYIRSQMQSKEFEIKPYKKDFFIKKVNH